MKVQYLILTLFSIFIFGCSTNSYNPDFIKKSTGRYLYNSDEIIKIYFVKNELLMEWRGAKNIKPIKVNETTFFVKEMNEKIQFLTNPENQKEYIVLIPKEENNPIIFNFVKLEKYENIPSEYLKNNEFNKALEGYLNIQQNDSLDPTIEEKRFNSLGYRELQIKDYKNAIHVFEINVALYPKSSNVYDSLAEAYMKSGDTVKAIVNYKKSLELDSGNKRAKNYLKKLEKSGNKN